MVWDRETGEPIYNAIVWQDTRTDAASATSSPATRASTGCAGQSACRSRRTSPGRRSRWILDNVDGARERAENGELAFGTMDTWLLWNLTGGGRRLHVTDVTNASPHAADGPRDARLARAERSS